MAVTPRIGGSFAPPLDADKLAAYRQAAETADAPTKDAMLALVNMVECFQQTAPSRQPGTPHPSGRGVIVPLEADEVARIWDLVPWDHELDAMAGLFDRLDGNSPLRTPAFHLLWYARELAKDREPITCDRI